MKPVHKFSLRTVLKGHKFVSDKYVEAMAVQCFQQQPRVFFGNGVQWLVCQWDAYLRVYGALFLTANTPLPEQSPNWFHHNNPNGTRKTAQCDAKWTPFSFLRCCMSLLSHRTYQRRWRKTCLLNSVLFWMWHWIRLNSTSMLEAMGWRRPSWRRVQSCSHYAMLFHSILRPLTRSSKHLSHHRQMKVINCFMS